MTNFLKVSISFVDTCRRGSIKSSFFSTSVACSHHNFKRRAKILRFERVSGRVSEEIVDAAAAAGDADSDATLVG